LVREFKEITRLHFSKLSFPVSGRIEGDGYVLTVGKRVVIWPASEVGEDDKGRFAVLTPGDMFVDEKVLVRVEEEPDDQPGYRDTTLTLRELADTNPYEQALWRNKIYPESVNLLVPAENLLCVVFGFDGNFKWVDGGETIGPNPLGALIEPGGD
jgi:hypothetical protein